MSHGSQRKSKRTVLIDGQEKTIDNKHLHGFFRWVDERHSIHIRRKCGLPPPWTEDPILQKHSFCNVFRVWDRDTQFLISEVIEKGDPDPAETIFRTFLFRFFNRQETWNLLLEKFGTPTLGSFSLEDYAQVLQTAFDKGTKLYTPAYIIPSPKIAPGSAFKNHLLLLERIRREEIPRQILKCQTLLEAHTLLQSLPGIGKFIGYQLVLDLNMIEGIDWPENDFAAFGPGSKAGLNYIFCGGLSDSQISKAIRYLYETQHEHWEDLGITDIPSLEGKERGISVPDIEHSLCEYAKYLRLQTVSGSKASRHGVFEPETTPLSYTLPSKSRSTSRASKTAVSPILLTDLQVESEDSDTYEVSHIVSERISRRGRKRKRKFKVRWVGYNSEDDSWLDEDAFENAKDVLADWKRVKHK